MIIKKMKKLLLLICLLPMASMAQVNTYIITQTGQAEFDTSRVFKIDSLTTYVTPTMLSDSLATVGGGSDTNALTTNTPMSATLDTVQRNGVNSALHISTVGAKLLSNGIGGTAPYSNGLHMVNYSPATGSALANQQVSPGLLLEGQGWATFSGSSKSVQFSMYTNPGSGVTDPIGNLIFGSYINGSYIKNPMFLSHLGQLTVDSSLTITDGTIDIAGTQSINVGSYHGIHNDAGFTSTGASDWKGYWMSGTITQSGGGSGITRGIYLNPVVTTAADYRAIETTNSVGKSIVTGTAPSTFGGTITFPTPFTLGATSVTSTGTQLNYLSSATGTTGTTSTNLVFSTSPTLVTPNLGTPSTLVGTNITGTASGLTAGNVTTNANLTGPITSVGNATSIASQTGTGTKFVVDNTPTLITPILGVASATSLNTGTTLNGTIFAKSANVLSLSSTNHALTAGNESTGLNLALGLYSTSLAIQARNNGSASNIFYNPLGGTVQVGDGSVTGQRLFSVINTGSGTGDWSSIEVRNAAASTDAIRMYCLGTGFTTSGTNVQDAGVLTTGTNISGGMSIGTQASADLRFYSNNTLRTTIQAGGNTIHTARVQLSKGANVASAGDLTLGSAGNSFSITGTTTINAITTTNWQAGSIIILIFASTPTVKHNTAGGASTAKMLLNGGVDFVASANDVLTLIYDGTNWLECSRSIN